MPVALSLIRRCKSGASWDKLGRLKKVLSLTPTKYGYIVYKEKQLSVNGKIPHVHTRSERDHVAFQSQQNTSHCKTPAALPYPKRVTDNFLWKCDKTRKIPLLHLLFETTGSW